MYVRNLLIWALAACLMACTPQGLTPHPVGRVATAEEAPGCTARDGSWACAGLQKPIVLASTVGSPIIPPSWTVANWWIDPANSTGCASDSNSGTSATCGTAGIGPLLTWHELNDHRWGCQGNPVACPRIQQTTAVNFLSSQAADSDIVYVAIATEGGATFAIQCPLGVAQQGATGTLLSVTAKNRNTPQLLASTFTTTTGTFALGQFLVNSTHPSRAWIFGGGPTFTISQPAVANTIPPALWPAEVNTWANGDAVIAYNLVQVNIANVQTILSKYDGSFDNSVNIYQCKIPDSSGINLNEVLFSNHVNFVESYSDRKIIYQASSAEQWIASLMNNAYVKGGVVGGAMQGVGGGFPFISSGVFGKAGATGSRTAGFNEDFDTIITGGLDVNVANFGTVYIDTAAPINVMNAAFFNNAPSASSTQIIWGPGSLDASYGARIQYPSGAGAAATAFKNTGGLQVNTQGKVCLAVQGGATSFGTCNLTLTAAQLDTSLGATSGCLAAGGGGSFCNYGP